MIVTELMHRDYKIRSIEWLDDNNTIVHVYYERNPMGVLFLRAKTVRLVNYVEAKIKHQVITSYHTDDKKHYFFSMKWIREKMTNDEIEPAAWEYLKKTNR